MAKEMPTWMGMLLFIGVVVLFTMIYIGSVYLAAKMGYGK